MLMNSKEALNKLVISEATNLKKIATTEELNNLTFDELNPNDHNTCVYGQLTGSCFSERATELIKKCCDEIYIRTGDRSRVRGERNGSTVETLERNVYWSPIEVFIDIDINKINGNNETLIAFLKNEVTELILT